MLSQAPVLGGGEAAVALAVVDPLWTLDRARQSIVAQSALKLLLVGYA
jgi:hypothetical protein